MIESAGLLMTGFWVLMLYDCMRSEPDRQTWLWILLFTNFPGALIYFFMRWIPRCNIQLPSFFSRWTRSRELWIAEEQARSIGKAHQFVNLGNLLYDMRMFEKAEDAYKQALEKEADNKQALWGAASLDIKNKKFLPAKEHLQKLLSLDPDYKYGDASMAYAETLMVLKEENAAKEHLEKHLKNWNHPEGYITLANILAQQGDKKSAREYLERMISKVRGSSYYHYKRNKHFINKAEKLLKKL